MPPFWLSKPFQKSDCPQPFFDIFPKTCPKCSQDASWLLQDTSKTSLRPSKKPNWTWCIPEQPQYSRVWWCVLWVQVRASDSMDPKMSLNFIVIRIKSVPMYTRILWRHNVIILLMTKNIFYIFQGKILHQVKSSGVIISGNSLAIQVRYKSCETWVIQ